MNRSSFVSKLFTPVITLLVLAYFGYQIYGYVSDPFSTTLAYTYQVEDTVDISGYVVRQEQVLTGDAGGLMRLRKNEGERIGTGGAVATVYADQASLDRQNEIETLNNRIEQLEYAQESMLGAEVTLKLDSQIARSLLDYRTVVAAGRLDAAESRGQELRSLVLKRDYTYSGTEDLSGQLQELKNQLKTLRSQAANSVKTIRSPRSGLFSAVVDGYESVLTPDSLSALTPSALNKLSSAEIPANTGKLILGDNWYYVGVVSAQEAQTLQTRQNRLGTGESLSLRFTKNVDRDLSVTLLSVGAEENGRCVVTFQGNTYLQELTLLRRQSAEIILDTTDGLRVPLAALRVATQTVTEKDPETEETTSKEVNVTGVYCVSGAKARFKPVEVLLTGDDYAVVRSAGSTEKLRLRPVTRSSLPHGICMTEKLFHKEREGCSMSIQTNIQEVRQRIAAACGECGRDPKEITLVGASKMNDAAACREAIAAGIDVLGENRVQEMTEKMSQNAYDGAPLHFIGHLQRNKVKQVVGKVALIQSVGSLPLLEAVEKEAEKQDIVQDILLEVNIGGEEAKSGFAPAQLEDAARAAQAMSHVRVRGLMTIPPADSDRDTNIRYFQEVRALYVDINEKLFHNELKCLSMGMSGDFEDAIRNGATMVRVGTAIFGARYYPT